MIWLACVFGCLLSSRAGAQDNAPASPPPIPPIPEAGAEAIAPAPAKEAQLEDEVRQLKAMVRELSTQDRSAHRRAAMPVRRRAQRWPGLIRSTAWPTDIGRARRRARSTVPAVERAGRPWRLQESSRRGR